MKKTLPGESRTADIETIDGWKKDQLMEGTKEYVLCDIYNADETHIYFSIFNLVYVLHLVETSAMVEQSKQQGSGVPYMYIVLANRHIHAALRC